MSVYTDADKEKNDLRENIYQAINNCNVILNPQTWGHEDFSKEYLIELNQIRTKLQEMQINLY